MNEEQELPQGWAETTLGIILKISPEKMTPTISSTETYIGLEHINKAVGTINGTGSANEVVSAKSVFKPGDILYGKLRPYLNKVYIPDFAGVCSTDILVLKPEAELPSLFFKYRILSADFVDYACSNVNGVQHPRVDGKSILRFNINLPPLPEQRRIVAKLEELFSKLDAGVAAVRRTQALLKRYRQSVLHAAVTGELTRAWREAYPAAPAETGAALLQRIRAERRAQWEAAQVAKRGGQLPLGEGWKAKYVEPEAVDTEGLPELPEGWTWASLDECLIQLRNGISTKPSESSGLRILRISAVRALQVKIDDVRYLPGTDEDYCDFLLKTGDLLFTRYNGNPDFVGVCGRVPDLTETTVYPDKLIRGRVVIDMSSFLQTVLNTGSSREYIRVRIKTTAGQAGIAGSDLKSVPVPLPPLAEQAEIVAEVERRLTMLDALSQTLTDELKRAERLRQSILHQAFTGRLVPQDATDEPAAALLARLRETAIQPKTRKTKETPAAPAKEKKPRGRKPADATQIDFSFTGE